MIIFLGILFMNKEKLFVIDPNQKLEKELTEEEKAIQYFLSLKEGIVVSVAEDYFVMDVFVLPKNFDSEEENEAETIRVKVNITKETKFKDSNDIKFIEIPEEYQEGLASFNYIKNIIDEEYVISVYIDTREDISQQGISEGQEITATYISWSCFPKDFIQ